MFACSPPLDALSAMSAEHTVAHEDASLIETAAGVVVLASDDGGVRDEAQKKHEREDEAQAGARITVPAELHAALHVPIPSFANGLEPIPVTPAPSAQSSDWLGSSKTRAKKRKKYVHGGVSLLGVGERYYFSFFNLKVFIKE